MEKNKCIEFLMLSRIGGMFFSTEKPSGIEFSPAESDDLRFILKPCEPEEDSSGYRTGLECKAYARYLATPDQVNFVESYIHNKKMICIADDISLPIKRGDRILVSVDGSFDESSPKRNYCPKYIQDLIASVERELSTQTDRFLELLRWRQGIDAPADTIISRFLYWKVKDGYYHAVPLNKTTPTTSKTLLGIHWGEEHHSELFDMWNLAGLTEPLGHALLREARILSTSSPRSSIMIMTAALESAIKTHISNIAPDTAWLMEAIPMPPIHKILRDFIPLIHKNRKNEISYWGYVKPLISNTQKLIEVRNKVAHTGKIPDDFSSIHDNLQLVSDLLCLLDVLEGHEWARSFVSYPLRRQLNWPEPRYPEIQITIDVD